MTSWPNPDSRELFIDIETYSSVDIRAAGLYPYVESDDFEVMLIAYAWGDDPVRLLDFSEIDFEEFAPEARDPDLWRVLCSLQNPNDLKIAHNNAFERTALRKQFTRYGRDFYLPPEEWHDTMILAAMNGLPLSLDAAGAALNIEQQKLKEGTALINYFCKPCKPTIANGGRTRYYPEHAPD
jgi:DNA polymerase